MPCHELNHSAVLSPAELLERLRAVRARSQCIVFTNGCFDLIHPGHVDLLDRAKKQGDILVLGLNSDSSVRRQNKGADRPINPFAVRAFVLAHLSSVDYITEFHEDTPLQLIRAIRPHVLVKGGDWSPDRIVGRDIVEADGGRVLALPLLSEYSTTRLLAKIRSAAG